MINRRKYPRFELKVEAKYKILRAEEAFKSARTRNVSAEGLCFESEDRIGIGRHVELEVDLKDKMSPVLLFGEVRWTEEFKDPKSKKKKFMNGIKLIDVPQSDEGRFLKYYCDRMVEKLSGYLEM